MRMGVRACNYPSLFQIITDLSRHMSHTHMCMGVDDRRCAAVVVVVVVVVKRSFYINLSCLSLPRIILFISAYLLLSFRGSSRLDF